MKSMLSKEKTLWLFNMYFKILQYYTTEEEGFMLNVFV